MSEAIDIGRSLEAALRGGFSLRQALVQASVDHPGLVGVARAARFGPLEAALDVWQATLPDSDTALYVAAARLQLEDHGNLADKFGMLSLILERR